MGSYSVASGRYVGRSLPRALAWSGRWLEQESLVLVVFGLYSAALLVRLPSALVSDSWMTFVFGREFWQHGLPHNGDLTAWTHGLAWADQQWLAQAVLGGLATAVGVWLALLTHAVLVIAAFGVTLVAPRRLGGSARSVALVSVLALPALMLDWVLRAQSIAYLLFAGLLWLLVSDSRRPSRRVYVSLALLVLWANVHGSVLLGAAIVALRGLTLLRSNRARAAVLIAAPWLCVFASPYGLGLVGYYRSLISNPLLPLLVPEWSRTTPSIISAGFYLLGFWSIWLLGRAWSKVEPFERVLVLAMFVNGMLAVRSMVWFSITAVVIIPRLLESSRAASDAKAAPVVLRRILPLAACAAAVVALGVGMFRAGEAPAAYPDAAAEAIAQAAAHDPTLIVFAETKYADWLLWKYPALNGRVAYDARFELLPQRRLVSLYFWESHIGKHWEQIPGCRAIVVVNRDDESLTERALLATKHADRIYRDAHIAVLDSRQPRASCVATVS